VGLVGGGGSPPPVYEYACCHLQAECLESGIITGSLCLILSMGTFTIYF